MEKKLDVGNGVATVSMGDTLITLWRDPATPDRVKWLNGQLDAFGASQPGDFLHFMLIMRTSTPPGVEGRRLFQQNIIALDAKKKLRQFVVVAMGDAFWFNIVRTAGRMIIFLAGKSHLLTLLGNLNEGTAALMKFAGPATPNAKLIKALTDEVAASLGVASEFSQAIPPSPSA